MSKPKMPSGLGPRGRKLWTDLVIDDMPADQASLLLEACRTADRLDELDALLAGRPVVQFVAEVVDEYENVIDITISLDNALMEVRQQQNIFKQLLATIRAFAPGAAKPAQGARGAYKPSASSVATPATPIDSGQRSWRRGA